MLVSQDVWRQLRGRPEFPFDRLGQRTLKGVGAIDIYLVNVDSKTDTPTPVATQNDRGLPKPQTIRSLAVLPFADLSSTRDQEYFGDGIAEEILNALGKIGGLHVPARTSSFAFRGSNQDARDIGKRLGVDALLEGSVRKAAQNIRVSVQLIDARTGYHLWSDRFDCGLEDIFTIQDEIASSVVAALGLSVGHHDRFHLVKRSSSNVEAYEFYLRGRKLFQKWTRENINLAREMFERAIAIDRNFAAAWAGLATAHVHLHGCDSAPHLQKAREGSARALGLDPQSAEAHVAAGQGFSMEQRYAEAAAAFERAIELDPGLFDAHYYYARSCFKNGDLEKSLRLFQKAHAVRPDDYEAVYLEALVLTKLARADDARQAFERALQSSRQHLDLYPDDARTYVLGAGALARLGQTERAKEWAERGMSLPPDDDAILYNAGCALAVIGEQQPALNALERAIAAGLAGGDWIPQDPDWEHLRDHPRFRALIGRLANS